MQISLGLIVDAIPIYLEDDDYDSQDLTETPVIFYEISTIYATNDLMYGQGSIIISGGFEYFTKQPESKIHEAIQLALLKEKTSFIIKN